MKNIDEAINSVSEINDLLPKVSDLHTFLQTIKPFYTSVLENSKSEEDVYIGLINMEMEYTTDMSRNNFAKVVHQLHPDIYSTDVNKPMIKGQIPSILDRLRCPHCNTRLQPEDCYAVHILNQQDKKCRLCTDPLNFESINVMAFRKDFDLNRYGPLKDSDLKMYSVLITDSWKEFGENVAEPLEKSLSKSQNKEHLSAKAAFAASPKGSVKVGVLGPGNGALILSPTSLQSIYGNTEVVLGSETSLSVPMSPIPTHTMISTSPNGRVSPIGRVSPYGSSTNLHALHTIHSVNSSHSNHSMRVQSPSDSGNISPQKSIRYASPQTSIQATPNGSMHSLQVVPSSSLVLDGTSSDHLSQHSDHSVQISIMEEEANENFEIRQKQLIEMVQSARGNISKLGIDLVHEMYRFLDFSNRIGTNYEYWTQESVLEMSIRRYHLFMILLRKRNQQRNPMKAFHPTLDILLVWYVHRLHQESYIEYNKKLNQKSGYKNDHIIDEADIVTLSQKPSSTHSAITEMDVRSVYAKTFIRWYRYYNEPYSIIRPSYLAWQRGHNLQSMLLPPVGIYRLSKWLSYSSTKIETAYKAIISSATDSSKQQQQQQQSSTNSVLEKNIIGTPTYRFLSNYSKLYEPGLSVINSNGGKIPYGGLPIEASYFTKKVSK